MGRKRGFALIELLITISILGLLASVTLAATSTSRAKARDARRIADIGQIINAFELYRSTHGSYPCAGGLVWDIEPGYLQALVNEGILSVKIKDPLADYKLALHYQYETLKHYAGGPCGQGLFIGYYSELPLTSCPYGGRVVGADRKHCHIFPVGPFSPPCPDPWLEIDANDDLGTMDPPCKSLVDCGVGGQGPCP